MSKDCRSCQMYIFNKDRPRTSRCRHPSMYIDDEIMLTAVEGRLSGNRCGPEAHLFVPKKTK